MTTKPEIELPASERLRLAQLHALDALDHMSLRIDQLADNVNNAPAKFAVTVGELKASVDNNTRAVRDMIGSFDSYRKDTDTKIASLNDRLAKKGA